MRHICQVQVEPFLNRVFLQHTYTENGVSTYQTLKPIVTDVDQFLACDHRGLDHCPWQHAGVRQLR